jgi:prepilin-type N-terminal cleavage/methylation domain-containing protein
MRTSTHKGFTLLELLVVVGMIAMLISVVGFNMFAGLSKARDSRRLQDINDLQKGLQLSLIADPAKLYITSGNAEILLTGTDAINTKLLSDKSIVQGIKDPLHDGTNEYWYKANANRTSYEIRFCLENDQVKNFKKGCANKKTP